MPIKLQGKEYAQHEELVQWATEAGLQSIHTEILHVSIEKQEAIVKATATGERGTYTGLGDCLPNVRGNVGKMVSAHWIRMAETRAINRALRLYTGRAMCSLDELGETPAGGRQRPDNTPTHSPAWGKVGKRFCTVLTNKGMEYAKVAAWCEAKGWGRPSGWPNEDDILNLLADIESGRVKPE